MSDWRTLSGPLAAVTLGQGDRIVFCHGFTQTGASWRPLAARFAASGFESVVVDLPGHGGSGQVRADLRRTADLLVSMAGPAAYVGYSLGGRLCLHAALIYPHAVRRLALIGASPGIDDDAERARRRASDDALATRLRTIGLEAFLREWMSQPLFGGGPPDDADLADRMTNSVDGLLGSLRLAGTGAQGSLWPRLQELTMPVLALAGERDTKFADIGRQVAGLVGDGTFASVAEADHAAHLQRPDAVAELLRAWLRVAR